MDRQQRPPPRLTTPPPPPALRPTGRLRQGTARPPHQPRVTLISPTRQSPATDRTAPQPSAQPPHPSSEQPTKPQLKPLATTTRNPSSTKAPKTKRRTVAPQ